MSESTGGPMPDLTECRAGAEQGDPAAQCDLGRAYFMGEGVREDETQGVAWFRKAADQGEPFAQYMLGLCHEKGRGVAVDDAAAARWYRKAAGQDIAEEIGRASCRERV